jgi:hypothetical protein
MHFFLGDRWKNHNSKTIGRPSGLFFFKYLIENFAKFPSNEKKIEFTQEKKEFRKVTQFYGENATKFVRKKLN